MESQQAEDLAARLVAQIDAVIGGVDGPTVLAAIEIAATTMATRALAGARQARMLEMIGRLARATHGPDGFDEAVAWLIALDLIERDAAGGFRLRPEASPRVVRPRRSPDR